MKFLLLSAGLLCSLFALPVGVAKLDVNQSDPGARVGERSAGWKDEWAVPEGFSLSIDTEGYHYPTAIAFVPNPGSGPKDPLYFVTELRGKVKVVTNDRTVYTFAEGFLRTDFGDEIADGEGQTGVGSICLAPARGYVFITFAYQDDDKILRNNVMRFKTTPGTFSIEPRSQRAFTEIFAPHESALSHQIGSCQVHDGMLYVSVGDGFNFLNSQQLDSPLGKIIRMTLDGKPVPTNPFYEDDDTRKARNYVWAYGLRNPFSLKVVDGHVMVADNGISTDRFLEVERGQNYLWNGSDESIATNADHVFLESVGPVQMAYYPAAASFFPPAYADQFYLAVSSGTGVMRLRYGFEDERLLSVPEYFVKNTDGVRFKDDVVGVAFGPDGLYFAPILPVRGSKAAVLKVKHDPDDAHDFTLTQAADPEELARAAQSLMQDKGCFGCHRVREVYEQEGTQAPILDRGDGPMIDRIMNRIDSQKYVEFLQTLNQREPSGPYKEARNEVIEAEGLARVRTWMRHQILDPQFDGPSAMPDQGLTENEASAITDFLLIYAEGKPLKKTIVELLPNRLRYRHVAYAVGAGIVIGLPIWLVLSWLARLGIRRRT